MVEAEGIFVAFFRWIYRRRRARSLEARKPWFKWFPKYCAKVHPAPEIRESAEPDNRLEERLQAVGFKHESWTKGTTHFIRGKSWGDFHAKLIKIRVSFSHPLTPVSEMRVEVANVCLFDTGDMWKVARELKDCVEAANFVDGQSC